MATVQPLDVFNYFQAAGYPASGAAAIVGNASGESSFNPSAVGDSGNSYGLWQLGQANQSLFQQEYGFPVQNASWQQQASFVVSQLQSPQYARTNAVLMSGGDVGSATYAFEKGFERPKTTADVGSRTNAANAILSAATGKGNGVLAVGGKLLGGALQAGLDTLPGGNLVSGAVSGALGSIPGLGGIFGGPSTSWVQQIEDWIKNSHFWQRIAIGILALIFIGGAIFLLGNKVIRNVK